MSLINNGLMTSGITRAYVIKREDTRIFIPGMMNENIMPEGVLDEANYTKIKEMLPKALFNSIALKNVVSSDPTPCWIAFENGDINRPIVMGFFGKGVKSVGGYTGSNDTSDFDNPNNFTPGEISGTTKNIVFKGHGSLTPTYLILHTITGPSESASAIINTLQNKNLGIHGIISNTGVIQTAEWNTKQWHAGGSANSVSIGLEMLECENIKWNQTTWVPSWTDDTRVKNYHDSVYNNAVNVYAALANMFNIPTENIISHREAHTKLGASNHGDPESLWNEFNKKWKDGKWTMDGFRENVDKVRKLLQ